MLKLSHRLRISGGIAALAAIAAAIGGLTRAGAQGNTAGKPAPELVGKEWINTTDGKPLSLAARRGRVTVVEFWTFGCSNCRANLPAYAAWHRDLAKLGVQVIGVHTPETESEKDPDKVRNFVRQLGIQYPVLLDPYYVNWKRWGLQYWPTIYVVDKQGKVRYQWIGELQKEEQSVTEKIRSLAAE